MTISFQPSLKDHWYQISCLTTKTFIGRCVLAFYLLLPFVGPSMVLYHLQTGSQAEHTTRHLLLPVVAASYFLLAVAATLGVLLGAGIAPKTKVTIEHEFCYTEILFTTKSPWRRFAKCVEEPDYLYFISWLATAYIPKSAFDSHADADAFYQMALQFWREAKGLPEPPTPANPDTAGVWPPAPRPTISAEPGDGPKG